MTQQQVLESQKMDMKKMNSLAVKGCDWTSVDRSGPLFLKVIQGPSCQVIPSERLQTAETKTTPSGELEFHPGRCLRKQFVERCLRVEKGSKVL